MTPVDSTSAASTTHAKRRGARAAKSESTTPRRGAKRTVVATIRQLPAYLRLLGGLLTDRRVSMTDKVLVAGAIVYIVSPIDLIPDFIPFFGQVDDVYILLLALTRLIDNAGRRVLMDHWIGDVEELSDLNLREVLGAAAFFLPMAIRKKLRRFGRRG